MIIMKLVILKEISMSGCLIHWTNRKKLRKKDRKIRLLLLMTMIDWYQ